MDKLTPEYLDELQALCDAAIKAPWTYKKLHNFASSAQRHMPKLIARVKELDENRETTENDMIRRQSALIDKAKATIERKDAIIAELRQIIISKQVQHDHPDDIIATHEAPVCETCGGNRILLQASEVLGASKEIPCPGCQGK